MAPDSILLDGATRDTQSVTPDWQPIGRPLLDGVIVVDITPVVKRGGVLTELFRESWIAQHHVAQVFQVLVHPGAVSAWHVHLETTDRLIVASGSVTLALYDTRPASPTSRQIAEHHLSIARPQLVVIPPGVWHGLIASGTSPALVLNLPDRAYAYDNPDHWRLPADTAQIPYTFPSAASAS